MFVVKRSAQVTGYIVLGLLLFLMIALLFSYREEEAIKHLSLRYDPDVEPVAIYVTKCMSDGLFEGLHLLGKQGGFIKFPAKIENELDATLALDENGVAKIPLWYHEGEARLPSIEGMQRQLGRYVDDYTLDCIDNFREFPQKVEILSNMSTNISLNEESVSARAAFSLAVTVGESSKKIVTEYEAVQPVRLRPIWELGRKIMIFNRDKLMFENVTLDLMSLDSKIPFTGLLFDCSSRVWHPSQITSRVQENLQENLQHIRIAKTRYPPFNEPIARYESLRIARQKIEQELISGLEDITKSKYYSANAPDDAFDFFHLFWDVGAEPSDLKVAVLYDASFGMDVRVNPLSDGLMRSKVLKGPIPLQFACMNTYHFVYDIYYPVRIDIRDDRAFDGTGFMFSFALPVSIVANEPTPLQRSMTVMDDVGTPIGFCDKINPVPVDLKAVGLDEDGYMSISGLDDVDFTYVCAGRRCPLGFSGAVDGSYKLTTNLPAGCDRPFIRAAKPGYLGEEKQLQGKSATLSMVHLKPFAFEFRKLVYVRGAMSRPIDSPYKKYVSSSQQISGQKIGDHLIDSQQVSPRIVKAVPLSGISDLLEGETVALTLVARSPRNYTQIVTLPSNQTFINLIDGSAVYDLDMVLSRQTDFGDQFTGGGRISNFTIRGSDVAMNNKIIFTVIEYRPSPITDAEERQVAAFLASEVLNASVRPRLVYE